MTIILFRWYFFPNCYVGVGVDLSGCLMLLLLSVRGAKKFHSIWKKQEKQRLWSSSEVTTRLLWIVDKQRLFRAVTISKGRVSRQNEDFQKERKWVGWSTIDRTSIWSGRTDIIFLMLFICCFVSREQLSDSHSISWDQPTFQKRWGKCRSCWQWCPLWGEGCENVQRVEM